MIIFGNRTITLRKQGARAEDAKTLATTYCKEKYGIDVSMTNDSHYVTDGMEGNWVNSYTAVTDHVDVHVTCYDGTSITEIFDEMRYPYIDEVITINHDSNSDEGALQIEHAVISDTNLTYFGSDKTEPPTREGPTFVIVIYRRN